MVGVRGKGGAMNLILAGKEGREQRDSRAPTDVAHKVADAGNLVELVARHAYIVERADGDKDERDSDDLDNAVFNNGPEGDAVVNGCCVIEPKRGERETEGDNHARIELACEDPGNGHEEEQNNGRG